MANSAVNDLDAWSIDETAFPTQGTTRQQLEFVLQYAVLAPSVHNTQPWLFQLGERTVELYADRSRALPVADPDDRELVMSCGAALLHLLISLRHYGLQPQVEIFARPLDPDLLATVELAGAYRATPQEEQLFRAIPKRRTNRKAFESRSLPENLLVDLQAAARQEGALLEIVNGEKRRNALVDLVADADRLQMANKRFRRELAAWVRPNRSSSRDGIPGYGFGLADLISVGGPFVIRTFDLGGFHAARDREMADGSPVLAVVSTQADMPRDWLAAGQALARVLLLARAEGVWASFLNQPIEVEELRPGVRQTMGDTGYPQLILRMGYGPEVRSTPRRPVSDVLLP